MAFQFFFQPIYIELEQFNVKSKMDSLERNWFNPKVGWGTTIPVALSKKIICAKIMYVYFILKLPF